MMESLSVDTVLMEPPAPYASSPPDVLVTDRIHLVRGHNVMLDQDLAEPYGVETKQLKRQVRRNCHQSPQDFMFELTLEEAENSKSQIGALKQGENIKYLPMAFTEQGVAMLSSVLNSEQVIQVNTHTFRVFTGCDEEIQAIFDHLTELIAPATAPRRSIGFKPYES